MNRIRRKWRLLAGVLAAAVLASGIAVTARGEDSKPGPKKDEAKKEEAKKDAELPLLNVDELFKNLGAGIDADGFKVMRQQMEETRKRMEQAMKAVEQRQAMGGLVLPGLPGLGAVDGFGVGAGPRPMQEPRLGVQLKQPSETLEDQLDLPKDQGMVLEEVGPNSAAAKAGLKPHDILLELNGKPAPSKKEDFVKLLESIKAGAPVDAVVMRKGTKQTIKGLTLPEAKAAAPVDRPAVVPGFPQGQLMLPRFGGFGGAGGLDGSTSLSRFNDSFTARNSAGDVTITVKGTIEDGKVKVASVTIASNGKTKTYDSVDKAPAEHRERVKKLVEMSARGGARFPLPGRQGF